MKKRTKILAVIMTALLFLIIPTTVNAAQSTKEIIIIADNQA